MAGYLKSLIHVAETLIFAAEKSAIIVRKKLKKTSRPARAGAVLRPGPATPLWNELATAVNSEFRRHGEKVKLARLLGISRQRLHLLVVARTACADAERTLAMLAWLHARQRGVDPT